MVTALLMGRKGSKDFSGKNLHNVQGRPLAYYPIKAARDCPEVDRIFLTTDDEKLIELAKENNIEIIKRPPELCTDQALGEDVYVHAYDFVKNTYKRASVEMIVLLMCNAATVTSAIISEGISVLRKNPEYDSAVTVSRYNMWSPLRARKIEKDGLLKPFVPLEAFGDTGVMNCDRNSQGDVWFADMGASIVRARCLENIKNGLLPQRWMGRKIYPLKQWGGFDIDYEWQLPRLEYWLKKNLNIKNET